MEYTVPVEKSDRPVRVSQEDYEAVLAISKIWRFNMVERGVRLAGQENIMLQRWIGGRMAGRPLGPHEQVRRISKDMLDLRRENLKIIIHRDEKGQPKARSPQKRNHITAYSMICAQ